MIGVIAGGGNLPIILSAQLKREGRLGAVIGINGFALSADISAFDCPAKMCDVGRVGSAIAFFREHDCDELIFAGAVDRSALSLLSLDEVGIKLLALLGVSRIFGGDDAVLRKVISFFESYNFRVLGLSDVTQSLFAKAGQLGLISASSADIADISLGREVLTAIGKFDIGQAVVVDGGRVLAIEGEEGTSEMIKRCDRGILVKSSKIDQSKRADLPTIGPQTIAFAIAHGLRGVAIEEGNCILVDASEIMRRADEAGLFVYGFERSAR